MPKYRVTAKLPVTEAKNYSRCTNKIHGDEHIEAVFDVLGLTLCEECFHRFQKSLGPEKPS